MACFLRTPPAAVYIDGRETATFQSAALDPGNGWSTLPPGSGPPSAPFDIPFSLILCVVGWPDARLLCS